MNCRKRRCSLDKGKCLTVGEFTNYLKDAKKTRLASPKNSLVHRIPETSSIIPTFKVVFTIKTFSGFFRVTEESRNWPEKACFAYSCEHACRDAWSWSDFGSTEGGPLSTATQYQTSESSIYVAIFAQGVGRISTRLHSLILMRCTLHFWVTFISSWWIASENIPSSIYLEFNSSQPVEIWCQSLTSLEAFLSRGRELTSSALLSF